MVPEMMADGEMCSNIRSVAHCQETGYWTLHTTTGASYLEVLSRQAVLSFDRPLAGHQVVTARGQCAKQHPSFWDGGCLSSGRMEEGMRDFHSDFREVSSPHQLILRMCASMSSFRWVC